MKTQVKTNLLGRKVFPKKPQGTFAYHWPCKCESAEVVAVWIDDRSELKLAITDELGNTAEILFTSIET